MRTHKLVIVSLALALVAMPALARKNVLDVQLDFRPQQEVGGAVVDISSDMRERDVDLKLRDERRGDEPAKIGTRTDDDDQRRNLRATSDVSEFVGRVLADLADQWGIDVAAGSGLVLDVALLALDVTEINQAVGATFNGEVRLSAKLENGSGEELWSGTAFGDATRYGKKFSNENVNEVLSDALLEAFAALLSDRGLHDAWSE